MGAFTYSYRRDIDGMRAIAVLMVIAFHLSPRLLPGGFTGVDSFFVISGYVVTYSLLKYAESSGAFDFIGFVARRVLRILPALVLCLSATLVAVTFLAVPRISITSDYLWTGLLTFLGASNFYLVYRGADYFAAAASQNPFTHTWSIAVEEQFYIMFGVIIGSFAVLRMLRRIHYSKIGLGLGVASLVALSASAWWGQSRALWAYYLMPFRFWELLSGAALCFLTVSASRRELRYGDAFVLVGLIVTIASAFAFGGKEWGPWLLAIGPVGGTLLMITGGCFGKGAISRNVLGSALMVYVGRLSYGLYLWHWPVFHVFRSTLGLEEGILVTAALGVTGLLSVLSYHFVERRFRLIPLTTKRAKYAVVGIGVVAAVLGAGSVKYVVAAANVELSLLRDFSERLRDPSPVREYPVNESAFELVVMGDSHAQMFYPMFLKAQEKLNFKLTDKTGSGCLFAEDIIWVERGRPVTNCHPFLEDEIERLSGEKLGRRVLFIGSRYTAYFAENNISTVDQASEGVLYKGERIAAGSPRAYDTLAASLKSTLARFRNTNTDVVMLLPIPELKVSAVSCLLVRDKRECLVRREDNERHRRKVVDVLLAVEREFRNVHVWDPFQEICPEHTCQAWIDDRLMYRDDDHLSVEGAEALTANYVEFLRDRVLVGQ